MSELDEAWVEVAIARHRWYERLLAELHAWVSRTEVSVRSPDQLVEVRVTADGSVRQVNLVGPVQGRTSVEVSRSIQQALSGAAEAAGWARRVMYAEAFGRLSEFAPAPPAASLVGSGQSGGATTTGSPASRGRSEPGRTGTTHEESGLGASGSARQRRQIRSTPIG